MMWSGESSVSPAQILCQKLPMVLGEIIAASRGINASARVVDQFFVFEILLQIAIVGIQKTSVAD